MKLLIAEKLETRELGYLSRANHYSTSTPSALRTRSRTEKVALCPPLGHFKQLPTTRPIPSFKRPGHKPRQGTLVLWYDLARSCFVKVLSANTANPWKRGPWSWETWYRRKHSSAQSQYVVWSESSQAIARGRHGSWNCEISAEKTTLLLTLQYEQVGIMELLVKKGANVNVLLPAGTAWYITFLQSLVRYGFERLVD